MEAEAEKKKENLSEDGRTKNLKWTVVGGKGEKRLVKTVQRKWLRGGRGVSWGEGKERRKNEAGAADGSEKIHSEQSEGETNYKVVVRGTGTARERETIDDSEVEMAEGAAGGPKKESRRVATCEKREEGGKRSPECGSAPRKH